MPRRLYAAPKPTFRDLDSFERTRRMMLGLPVIRNNMAVPFGFKEHPDNSSLFLPDIYALTALAEAKRYLEAGHTYENVSNWLKNQVKLPLSPMGLFKVLRDRSPIYELLKLDEDERERIALAAPADYRKKVLSQAAEACTIGGEESAAKEAGSPKKKRAASKG